MSSEPTLSDTLPPTKPHFIPQNHIYSNKARYFLVSFLLIYLKISKPCMVKWRAFPIQHCKERKEMLALHNHPALFMRHSTLWPQPGFTFNSCSPEARTLVKSAVRTWAPSLTPQATPRVMYMPFFFIFPWCWGPTLSPVFTLPRPYS